MNDENGKPLDIELAVSPADNLFVMKFGRRVDMITLTKEEAEQLRDTLILFIMRRR